MINRHSGQMVEARLIPAKRSSRAMPARMDDAAPVDSWTERSVIVFVIDGCQTNVTLMQELLPASGYSVRGFVDATVAIDAVVRDSPDVVVVDIRTSVANGFNVCRLLKGDDRTRFIPVILVTARPDANDRLEAIEAGADEFIATPVNPVELRARVQALARNKRYSQELESVEGIILSLAMTVEARDAYTEGHCQRIAAYAEALGNALGLSNEELRALRGGGFLHDVGKIGIPDAILLKPGPLTATEFEVMKTHTLIGERLCGELRSLSHVRAIIRSHHERRDGSGYPDGLVADEIPLLAEIIGLVDVYDALTSTRPYREAVSVADARDELRKEAGRGLHRVELVELFLNHVVSPPDVRAGCASCASHRVTAQHTSAGSWIFR